MANKVTLTLKQACRFLLSYQGLLPPRRISGSEGILGFFHRVGCIQFDPLNIVGTNPELVLQSRVKGFRPEILETMLYQDRALVDDWDKMMAIYPVTDRPYFHYRQLEDAGRSGRRNTDDITEVVPLVRKAIEERGPLSSIDLDHNRKVDWSWGPTRLAKVALEDMYYRGELIVHHKANTRKYYDLASRYIPAGILNASDPHPTREEYHDWHVLRRLRGLGMAWDRPGIWAWIHGAGTRERQAALERLIKKKEVQEVRVEGVKYPFYVSCRDLPLLQVFSAADTIPEKAAIIAPLDNIMWDREFISTLFGFNYRWEVYKPVAQREYGYYVLPVIYGDRFIARFEPGRDKKSGALEIKNWWWESEIKPENSIRTALRECFGDFLNYLGAAKIEVDKRLVKREALDWLP